MKIKKHFDYLTPFEAAQNADELREILALKYPKACTMLKTHAQFFASMVDDVRKFDAWKCVGCVTFEEFCSNRLGKTLEEVESIVSGVKRLVSEGRTEPITEQEALNAAQTAMLQDRKLKGHGKRGLGKTPQESHIPKRVDNVNSFSGCGANVRSYLAARIKRDHPDIAERIQAGEFRSIHAAAIAAGIAKPTITIRPTVEGFTKAIKKRLTPEQIKELVENLSGD